MIKRCTFIGFLITIVAIAFSAGSALGQVQEKEKISIAKKEGIGSYLAQSNGKALYTYKNDSQGTSSCQDACAEKFPVYCYKAGEIKAGKGLKRSDFRSFKRTGSDTLDHLTYKGMPLYEYSGDNGPGDTNGHGVDDLWSVARP